MVHQAPPSMFVIAVRPVHPFVAKKQQMKLMLSAFDYVSSWWPQVDQLTKGLYQRCLQCPVTGWQKEVLDYCHGSLVARTDKKVIVIGSTKCYPIKNLEHFPVLHSHVMGFKCMVFLEFVCLLFFLFHINFLLNRLE